MAGKRISELTAAGAIGGTELVVIVQGGETVRSTVALIGDARITAQKGFANGLAPLDAGGKIASSYLPAIAITSVYEAANEAAQLALSAQEGDVAVRSDENKSYVHNGGVAGTMADWTLLKTPTDTVTSVNGMTGVVSLSTTDIPEGTNLYYTDERVDDRVAAFIQNGGGITWLYDDGLNTLTPSITITLSQVSDAGTMAAEDAASYYDAAAVDALLDGYDTKEVSINNQVDNYVLVAADAGKYIRMDKATAVTLTIPDNADVAFPVGTKIYIRQVGAGQVTIVEDTAVTINTPETLLLKKQNAAATLIKVGTDVWDLEGNLEAL